MIDPRASSELTPDRLRAIKGGRDPQAEATEALHQSPIVATGRDGARPYRPRALHADPRLISPRWPHAVARIFRICEGAKASAFDRATDTSEVPRLAKRYAEIWLYYMTRTRPAPMIGTDHNPFRGLSDYDAMRMFVRRVEDICDKSTGKLGAWYVK